MRYHRFWLNLRPRSNTVSPDDRGSAILKTFSILTLLAIIFFIAAPTHAFDDRRDGFFVSAAGALSPDYYYLERNVGPSWDEIRKEHDWSINVGMIGRVGLAPIDQLGIFIDLSIALVGRQLSEIDNVIKAFILPLYIQAGYSLGGIFFFQPKPPSIFIDGGFGLRHWVMDTFIVGVGPFLGFGYEFEPKLQAGARINYDTDVFSGYPIAHHLSCQLVVGYMFY